MFDELVFDELVFVTVKLQNATVKYVLFSQKFPIDRSLAKYVLFWHKQRRSQYIWHKYLATTDHSCIFGTKKITDHSCIFISLDNIVPQQPFGTNIWHKEDHSSIFGTNIWHSHHNNQHNVELNT